jgi:hypothetical protein
VIILQLHRNRYVHTKIIMFTQRGIEHFIQGIGYLKQWLIILLNISTIRKKEKGIYKLYSTTQIKRMIF